MWLVMGPAYEQAMDTEQLRLIPVPPFRYPGQYEDDETGLYYNRFRYYDPEVGHYLSQDPLGLAGGPALYAYVADPLTQADVLGLSKGSGTLGSNLVKAGQTHGITGFTKGEFQAHHVIPHEVWVDNQSFFDEIGLNKPGRNKPNPKDAASNGVFLPKDETIGAKNNFDYYHRGSHTDVNTDMGARVTSVRERYESSAMTDVEKAQACKEIKALQDAERNRLSSRTVGGPCGRVS
jgi:RHS repeat-associated protein